MNNRTLKVEKKSCGKWSDLAHSERFWKELDQNSLFVFSAKNKQKKKSLKAFIKYKNFQKKLYRRKTSKKLIKKSKKFYRKRKSVKNFSANKNL